MIVVTTGSVCSFAFVRKSAVIDVIVLVKPPVMVPLLSSIRSNITCDITSLVISHTLSSGLTEPVTPLTILAQAHR